jgi:uncharacterized protein
MGPKRPPKAGFSAKEVRLTRIHTAAIGEAPPALATQVTTVRPTRRQERIGSLDVLRGVALLGILIANVTSFGLPEWAYFVPLGTARPVFTGPHADLNTAVWFLRWIVMEGKMRGLFSLLFGAGAVLLLRRLEKHGDAAADIFLRRNMWLTLFGILHAYLVWFGDILYWYGLTALLFLFPCRRLEARSLLTAGIMILAVSASVGPFSGGQVLRDFQLYHAAEAAKSLQQSATLTDAQTADLKAWNDRLEAWKPGRKAVDDDIAVMRSGYIGAQLYSATMAAQYESALYYSFGVCDVLGMMLIGMGLFKCDFLTGDLSGRTYAFTALAGFLISVPVVATGAWEAWASHFDLLTTDLWMLVPYDLGRATGAIAIASTVLLVVRSKVLEWATSSVAAVGRTALSNYLMTSILCKFIFVWGPWHLYGNLEYYQLYFVLAAVWALNLTVSGLWLRYFEFGPAEWAWRSLTYWRWQPMLLQTKAA